MQEPMTWEPKPTGLPWKRANGGLDCPACPSHTIRPTERDERYEIVIELAARDGSIDAIRVTRRSPGLVSGPFGLSSPLNMESAIVTTDYLERQTFDVDEARRLLDVLADRFQAARIHVWPIGTDIAGRVAEDAYWEGSTGVLVRSPTIDISPCDYPQDFGWRIEPERVVDRSGHEFELSRGCLYVDLDDPKLVRYAWSGLDVE